MQTNTNLLNLVVQILAAQAGGGVNSTRNGVLNVYAKEVMRLKILAVQEIIASAPAANTYTDSTALIKLEEVLDLFKVRDRASAPSKVIADHSSSGDAIEGVVHRDLLHIQNDFEHWAKREGYPVDAARYDECEDGRFPANYHHAHTETAWRAWANKPNPISIEFEPVAYIKQDHLDSLLADKNLDVPAYGIKASIATDVSLYRVAQRI